MTTQHTPTPWLIEYDPEEHKPPEFSCVDITVGPPTGHTIAHVDPHNEMPQHADANAAYIVLACNAHEELVEALQATLRDLDETESSRIYGGTTAIKLARAALALAKGETT